METGCPMQSVIYALNTGWNLFFRKAANLLYFVTKNHSFFDENKRIAATIFLYFLDCNGILYNDDGKKLLDDHTLVALTIMIAESRPEAYLNCLLKLKEVSFSDYDRSV